ncbi:MAG: hypothetical protein ACOCQN_00665, partial [Halanaerobiaceae bacterium]
MITKKTTLIMIIMFLLLYSLPIVAFSPLDDPEERYDFEYREGKYKVSLDYRLSNRIEEFEDLGRTTDYDPEHNYILTLEYNLKQGVKLKLNKYWVPEFTRTITNNQT